MTQEEGNNPGSFLSRTGYIFNFTICLVIWAIKLQSEIALSTMETEYIALSQAMTDVLPFLILVEEIKFVLELQGDSPKVQCSILIIQSQFTNKIKVNFHSRLIHKCDLFPSTSRSSITTSRVSLKMVTYKYKIFTQRNRSRIFLF